MSAFAHAMSPFLRYHLIFSVALTSLTVALTLGAITHIGASPFGIDRYETAALLFKSLHAISLAQLLFLPVLVVCLSPRSTLLGGDDELTSWRTASCMLMVAFLPLAWVLVGRTFVATELQLAAADAEDLLWLLAINPMIPMVVHGAVIFLDSFLVARKPQAKAGYTSNGIV